MKPIAVILAGGKSSRFAPFVTNKTMWPFCGKVTLQYTIEQVQSAGLDDIIVVANRDNENFLKQYQTVSPNLQYRLQDEALGMDDALQLVSDLISRRSVIVLNAIDFFETNLIKRMLDKIDTTSPKLLVCGLQTDTYTSTSGYYVMKDERVVGVIEKPTLAEKPSNVVRLVIDYYQDPSELIALFPNFENSEHKDARYELAQNELLKKYGAEIEYSSYWSKLKYPHSVLDVMDTLFAYNLDGFIHPTSRISPHAIVEGAVYVDEGARIEAGAVIKGPSYIGKRVIIGNNALIRQSMVEEGSTVGFGSEIARSYVGPDCQIHHSFVGDSILEKAVNMSWGTVTANLRLDRTDVKCKLPDGTRIDTGRQKLGAIIAKEAFLGVNASTMPGICLTAKAHVLPGTIVK